MIRYICDWCDEEIASSKEMTPPGGGADNGTGVTVSAFRGQEFKIKIGPVAIGGSWNGHQLHRSCAQDIVATGKIVDG